MLTRDQLQEIRKVIGDMRLMQAAALVASGQSDAKDAKAYMQKLARLDKLLGEEITA